MYEIMCHMKNNRGTCEFNVVPLQCPASQVAIKVFDY